MRPVATVFSFRLNRLLIFAIAGAVLGLGASNALAAQIIVTTGADQPDFADGCSLREAIVNAETDSKSGSVECARGEGDDEIILLPGVMQIDSSLTEESDPAAGDLDIRTGITLLGSGQQFSVIDAGFRGRIFDVHPGGRLTLRGVLLRNGYADDSDAAGQPYGGAVRVAGPGGALPGGELIGEDIGILDSYTDDIVIADAMNDRGAGIYAGPGTVISITRGQFIRNETRGAGGHGAGIYCDGCELFVDAATFANNDARRGGGIYAGAGSDTTLKYVTLGFNDAIEAAGIYNAGALSYFASISADNGAGSDGDDLWCDGGATTFAGQYSFAEYPLGCTPMSGVRSRPDLPAGTEATVLFDLTHQRFTNQPGSVLQVHRGEVADTVPAAQCLGHYDQLGTPGVHTPMPGYASPVSTDPGCSSGAYEYPVAAVGIMAVSTKAPASTSVQLSIGVLATLSADVQMHFRARGAGGIGESCDLSSVAPVTIPQVTAGSTVTISGALLFPTLSLERRKRVCEFEGVLSSPEGIYNGATTGVLRVLFDDGLAESGDSVSTPAAGAYLEFGNVAPAVGGNASIYFKANSDPLQIVSSSDVVISGTDPSEFSLASSQLFPLTTATPPGSAVPLTFHCNGSALGDYDAVVTVNAVRTISGTPETLVYGLRCRVAHLLTLLASPDFGQINEADPRDLVVSGRLDSPNSTGSDIRFSVFEVFEDGGTAVPDRDAPVGSDGDYVALVPVAGDPVVMVIPPGETEAYVEEGAVLASSPGLAIDVIDDQEFSESLESILLRAEMPVRDDVAFASGDTVALHIVDNDVPSVGAAIRIGGMPTHVKPGSQQEISIVADNTSSLASFNTSRVTLTVDPPVRILSYLMAEVEISCTAHRQYLIALYPDDPVAQQAALDDEPCTTGDVVSSMAKDLNDDGIADTVPFSSALALLASSFCSITTNTRTADCSFGAMLPAGAKVRVNAILQMATMSDAPQLDFAASMQARIAGVGGGATGNASDTDEVSFVIDGNGGAQSGVLGWPYLVFFGLLALRGVRERSAGRKAG